MNNSQYFFARPANEPVNPYLQGTPERKDLEEELQRQSEMQIEIPLVIGGQEIRTGNTGVVVSPHNHKKVLATYHKAGERRLTWPLKLP